MAKKTYRHISHFERGRIFQWLHYERLSMREIARRLNRSHSSISREIKRNYHQVYTCLYYPNVAQRKAQYRLKHRAQRYRLNEPKLRNYVIDRLKKGWSPEIISGRLELNDALPNISHEAIYQFIYKKSPDLIQFLARQHKRRRPKVPYRKKPSRYAGKTMITERPEVINHREEFGHWESDTIESGDRKGGLNVVLERVSRLTHISKLESKNASDTQRTLIKRLKKHQKESVKSITYDNGPENALHQKVNQKLGIQSYFCLPYHSWEKGAVEQVNGLIRRYIPKKTNISKISPHEIIRIEKLLNNRPRKCLNYKTPYEVFSEKGGALLF